MRNEIVAEVGGRRVVAMDSISLITSQDRSAVVVSGSHGGAISGAFAGMHPPALVFFNDAGGGKNGAGVASLANLDLVGIPAATIAHVSARIGDALDGWHNGTVSRANGCAALGGVETGQSVRQAVEVFAMRAAGGHGNAARVTTASRGRPDERPQTRTTRRRKR
jgi:hypothetical protein